MLLDKFTGMLNFYDFSMEATNTVEQSAELINRLYSDKKLIIYEDESESKKLQSFLTNKKNILASIKSSQDQINVSYDFLVLLGPWRIQSLMELSFSLEVPMDKLLLPEYHKNKQQPKFPQITFKDKTSNHSRKTIFVLIQDDLRGDFIVQYSQYLSKHFNLIGIQNKYFGALSNKDEKYQSQINPLFQYIYTVKDNYFQKVINCLTSIKHDAVIVCNGVKTHWITPFVKNYTQASVISIDKDFSIMSYHEHCYDKLLDLFKTKARVTFEQECEDYSLKKSSALITSLGGDFITEKLLPFNQHIFHYIPFMKKEDYCYHKKNQLNEQIKLIYAGSLFPEKVSNLYFENAKITKYFKQLSHYNFTIQLYPVEMDNQDIQSELKAYPSIQLHKKLMVNDLLQNIQSNDFGLILNHTEPQMPTGEKDIHYEYNFVTKAFTYLAAGLPILIDERYKDLKHFLFKEGVAIEIKHDQLDSLEHHLKSINYDKLKQNVLEFQQTYSIQNNQQKLIQFLKASIDFVPQKTTQLLVH